MNKLDNKKVLITCGTGGVGKTTISAALALRQARLGKRTVVITIDPAKRLATSLGLSGLEDQPTRLTDSLRACTEKQGLPFENGEIYALMPDTRKTLENFFRSLAPNSSIAEKLIKNPIFEIFAREFSGANEYMALERLDGLVQSGLYDCIILDTPPSRNTLAFLNAPQLLARLFEEGFIKWLVLPANQILATGIKKALGVLEKLTGEGFIGNLLEFAAGILELQTTFTAKVKRVSDLISSDQVGFIMVTGPTPETLPEFEHFLETLQKRKLEFEGLIVNRTLGSIPVQTEDLQSAPTDLKRALETLQSLQEREKRVTAQLKYRALDKGFFIQIPELSRDVHQMEDLFHVSLSLDQRLRSTDQSNAQPN